MTLNRLAFAIHSLNLILGFSLGWKFYTLLGLMGVAQVIASKIYENENEH